MTVAFFVIYHAVFAPTWALSLGVSVQITTLCYDSRKKKILTFDAKVYAAEVNSIGWRTRGAGAATATNWVTGFAVVQFTKVGIDNLQWAFFLSKFSPSRTHTHILETRPNSRLIVFAILCLSFFPVVYCFYPETAGRKLEDMDQMFLRNPSWFVFGKKEMTQPTRPQAFIDEELAQISDSQVTIVEVTPDKLEEK